MKFLKIFILSLILSFILLSCGSYHVTSSSQRPVIIITTPSFGYNYYSPYYRPYYHVHVRHIKHRTPRYTTVRQYTPVRVSPRHVVNRTRRSN